MVIHFDKQRIWNLWP